MENRWFFKAKRKDDGEWVFGGLSYCEKTNSYFITNMGKDHISYIGFHQEVDSNTICQCTGLKDKNGKLIWENDICKYQWNGKTKIDVIKYDPPMFSYSGAMRWNLDCDEVIGNKFDNPELLEE